MPSKSLSKTTRRTREKNTTGSGIPVISRGVGGNTQTFKFSRVFDNGLIQSGASSSAFGYYFLLSALPGYAEFTSLFDQYRIDKVDIFLRSMNTKGLPSTLANGALSYMVLAPDYDDVSVPSGESAVLQKQNVKILETGDDYLLTIVPHIAVAAYSGAFTGYDNVGPQWIDSASSSVQHYGWKYWMSAPPSASLSSTWHYYARVHLSFRNVQ